MDRSFQVQLVNQDTEDIKRFHNDRDNIVVKLTLLTISLT